MYLRLSLVVLLTATSVCVPLFSQNGDSEVAQTSDNSAIPTCELLSRQDLAEIVGVDFEQIRLDGQNSVRGYCAYVWPRAEESEIEAFNQRLLKDYLNQHRAALEAGEVAAGYPAVGMDACVCG